MINKKIKKLVAAIITALCITTITLPVFAEEPTADVEIGEDGRPVDYDPDAEPETMDTSLTHCHLVVEDYGIVSGSDADKEFNKVIYDTNYSGMGIVLTYSNVDTKETVEVNFGQSDYYLTRFEYYTTFDGTYALTDVKVYEYDEYFPEIKGEKYIKTTTIAATPDTENVNIVIDVLALIYENKDAHEHLGFWRQGYSEHKDFFKAVFEAPGQLETEGYGEAETFDSTENYGIEETTAQTINETESEQKTEQETEATTENNTKTEKKTFKDWFLNNLILIIIIVVLIVGYLIYHAKNTKTK